MEQYLNLGGVLHSASGAPLKGLVCSDYFFLCIGTELRRDDAAGLRFCDILESGGFPKERLVKCEFGLENCASVVEEALVRKAVLVDAMISLKGEDENVDYILTDLKSVDDERMFLVTTHSIPVKFVVEVLRSEGLLRDVLVLGIVARDLSLGEGLSERVQEVVEGLARMVLDLWRECSEAGRDAESGSR
ncbi:MAG: hydrogenase maturation protease [Zestosphaera sp.]